MTQELLKAGDKYNMLVAIKRIGRTPSGAVKWLFRCDCGNLTPGITIHVRKGAKKSCGCLNGLVRAQLADRYLLKHGGSRKGKRTAEYVIWCAMKERCSNPNNKAYKNYGARGILVEEPFRSSFQAFLDDVGLRPSKQHSLERVNNDGNYAPGNVRWATRDEQGRNKRPSINCQSLVEFIRAADKALEGGDVALARRILQAAPGHARGPGRVPT